MIDYTYTGDKNPEDIGDELVGKMYTHANHGNKLWIVTKSCENGHKVILKLIADEGSYTVDVVTRFLNPSSGFGWHPVT